MPIEPSGRDDGSRADSHDAIVVGAGPAGLSAALYLARFCRSTLVLHDGTSRALSIPRTRNVPGFDRGIRGPDLLRRMESHARRFGGRVAKATIVDVERGERGFLLTDADGNRFRTRSLVLATGMETDPLDLAPDTVEAAIAAGVLRYCPVCDGYEHKGQRIAVLGDAAHAAGEALFLRTYSGSVTLLCPGEPPTDAVAAELQLKGVELICGAVEAILPGRADISVQIAGAADVRTFDVLYPARGSRPRTALAAKLGLGFTGDGTLDAQSPFRTAVPGLYAIGDIVDGLDQISVAMGQGAVAATKAHNWLREQDGWLLESLSA